MVEREKKKEVNFQHMRKERRKEEKRRRGKEEKRKRGKEEKRKDRNGDRQ